MYFPFHDERELAQRLAAQPLGDGGHWMLLLAARHADRAEPLVARLNALGVPFFGALFPGLIEGAVHHSEGVIARPVRCLAPPARIDLGPGAPADLTALPAAGSAPATCLILLDSQAERIGAFLTELFHRYGNTLSYFGAGGGYGDLRPGPVVFGPWGVARHAAIVALVTGSSRVRARHGWERDHGPLIATRTRGNRIEELNWEPAEQVYRSLLGPPLGNVDRRRLFAEVAPGHPLAIDQEGGEDVVRDPIALTDEGALVCLSDVPEGSVLHLMRGEPEHLIGAAVKAVEDCAGGPPGRDPLVCDCLSRTIALGDQFPRELERVSAAFARLAPGLSPEGVLALGEIASDGEQAIELYNKTFGLCLFHD